MCALYVAKAAAYKMQKNITTQAVFLLDTSRYQPVGIRTTKRDTLMWVKEKDSTNRFLFGAILTKFCH